MSDIEDGQLRHSSLGGDLSAGGIGAAAEANDADNDDDEAEEEEDEHVADSLDIKPPQAKISRSRDPSISSRHKDKTMRDKKHSKDKRHSKEHHHHHPHHQQQQQQQQQDEQHHYHHHQHRSSERGDHRDRDRDRKVSRSSGGPVEGSAAAAAAASAPSTNPTTSDRRVSNEHHNRHDDRGELMERHFRLPPAMHYFGSGVDDERDMRYAKHYERGSYHYQQQQQQQQQQQYSNSRKGHFDYYGREPANHQSSYPPGGSASQAAEYGGHHRHHHHSGSGGNSDLEVGGGQQRQSERGRKYNSNNYEIAPNDVENLEQDLRSRLLSKRHNFVNTNSFVVDGPGHGYELPMHPFDDNSRHKMSRHEKEHRERERNSHREHRDRERVKVIEVLDSPVMIYPAVAADSDGSQQQQQQHRRKHKRHKERPEVVPPTTMTTENHEKRKTPDDPELLARRAKILAAEREKTKRRDELEARREQRRNERAEGLMDTLSPSAIAASMTAGLQVVKRKSKSGLAEGGADDYDDGEIKRKRKRLKKAKRSDGELDDDDDDDEDDRDRDDDDDDDEVRANDSAGAGAADDSESGDSDSDSDSASNISSVEEGALSDGISADHYKAAAAAKEPLSNKKKAGAKKKPSKAKRQRDLDEAANRDYDSDGDIRLPDSPFSMGELSKSPKSKKRHSKKSSAAGKHKHKHHHHHRHQRQPHHHHHHHHEQPASEDTENDANAIHSVSEDSLRSRTNSRSQSSRYRSRSRSHSQASASESTSSSSHSRSASQSSRSGSRSASQSGSRSGDTEHSSRSRSHSRSRSNSRSRSEERGMAKDANASASAKAPPPPPQQTGGSELPKPTAADNSAATSLDESPLRDDKGKPLPNYYPGIQGCRSVEEFQCLNRIEEGTYGVVYRAKDKRTNEIVALKRLKMEKEKEGFPITSLREINTLLKGQHPNIVTVREIVVGSNMDKIFIVMDYVEHDLKSLMETMKHRKQVFFPGEVKCLIQQLLRAVGHLHDNWILHRDLKTSNLLLSHKGILKVGDFGLAREYGSPLKKYTSLVVTLWYRAPELLLCSPEYSTGIDIWSVGCIFAEFLQMAPMFPGKAEIDQLNRIFKELGTPNEKVWPGYNELPAVKNLISQNSHFADYPVSNLRKHFGDRTTSTGISLMLGLLTYDPKQRLNADAALKHDYFKELPLPIDPSMFPTWPAKSELGARKAMASSPKPPSGGSQFKQLGRDDVVAGGAAAGVGGGPPHKIVSGIITGNKKSAANTGFVLNAGIDQRQLAMGGGPGGGGFKLKF